MCGFVVDAGSCGYEAADDSSAVPDSQSLVCRLWRLLRSQVEQEAVGIERAANFVVVLHLYLPKCVTDTRHFVGTCQYELPWYASFVLGLPSIYPSTQGALFMFERLS